jgi:adenylate cyclase
VPAAGQPTAPAVGQPTAPAARLPTASAVGQPTAPAVGVHNAIATTDPGLLLMVSNRLAATQSLEGQLGAIVEIASEATGAERGTIFLNDPARGGLYGYAASQGGSLREVRILANEGIAGAVFASGKALLVDDAYADERFSCTVDQATGYRTRNILAVPIRTLKGEVIGVVQCLNRHDGQFTTRDRDLVEAMATQASIVLQGTLYIARMEQLRRLEAEFLELVAEVSSEIHLGPLLQKIMSAVTRMLDSDRSTLFLNDPATNELYTEIGQGLGAARIRMSNSDGIAGVVFTTGRTINIPHAYADLRFNPSFDRSTGYFTRSILCVPVTNKDGRRIGVTQVLNKRGGAFTAEDEARLRAFTAQIAIGIENARLFEDVQRMKNYNDAILESMSNGVLTLDADGRVVTCNAAGLRILRTQSAAIVGRTAGEFFGEANAWLAERLRRVAASGEPDTTMDAELALGAERVSVNVTTLPLSVEGGQAGSLQILEDISTEKRIKSTMAKYMDPAITDQLLARGEDLLGGKSQEATILFSDIRGFTTLTEELGAQGTVALLNEYFTIMVECISRQGGMLDKFIGDAIMAIFGTPLPHEDDADRAIRAAIAMLSDLRTYNETRLAFGRKPIDMGVGLNTGQIVSGNIGSPKRMDYTVIGDGVNLASRLEGACKEYGARILVSEDTLDRARGTYRMREMDRVIVKGKTQPVAVYEVLDYHTDATFPNLVDVLGHFRDGLELYRDQRFDDACAAFEEALAANPADRASQLYVERCRLLRASPPGPDWSGVFTMQTK